MKRNIVRRIVRLRYKLRAKHRKLGLWLEFSHLAYFGILLLESKYMYAKVGGVCMLFSILYMLSDEGE